VEKPSLRVQDAPLSEWVDLGGGIRARTMVEGNGAAIILYRMDPGRRFARHRHPYPELGVVLIGRGHVLIGEERRPIREGDSFFFPGNVLHGIEVDESGPLVSINVTLPLLSELDGPRSSEVLELAKGLTRTH
jgi:quercetin dioxygenase-like cupin family protein